MSGNNDNDASASKLIATEEAFEQFQVTATNDENDFVLLSDILPAEDTQQSADFPDTMEEIPLGAEEVTSTESFLPGMLNGNYNSSYETVGDSLTQEYTSTNPASTSQPEDTSETVINEPVKKRRGRKPKNLKNNQDLASENINKTPSNSSKSFPEDHNSSSTPGLGTRGKRGRKPINYRELDAGQDLDITSSGLDEDAIPPKKSLNRKLNNDSKLDDTSNMTVIDTEKGPIKLPKKRGRKKKNIDDSVIPQGVSSLNNVDLSENHDLDQDLDDGGQAETSNTTVPGTDNGQIKSPKKRGRKKKKIDDSNLNNQLLLSNVNSSKQRELEMNDDDDDEGDMVLSKLKNTLHEDNFNSLDEPLPDDRPTKKPILSDFEYDVNSVIAETPNVVVETVGDLDPNILPATIIKKVTDNTDLIIEDQPSTSAVEQKEESTIDETLLVENSSKRPQRRKAKRMQYEVDSDEDPFANVELSEEDNGGNRKKRPYSYYSDDEYVPGQQKKKGKPESSSDDMSALEDIEYEFEDINRRRRGRKKSEIGSLNKSPGKRGRKKIADDQSSCISDATTVKLDNRSDNGLDDSKDAVNNPKSEFISGNKEFENFLARRMQDTSLKIKKVDKTTTSDNNVVPLEIPVMEAKDMKPTDTGTQTNIVATTSTSVQTTSAYAIKLAKNIDLSSEQSQNACEFLKNILKTTTELGTLMTEKSDEFIDKKINATYVKDTTRIDYCVKKAFLLFKLAKDNLTTMEDNLEKQYEEFLKTNKLSHAIEVEKKIISKVKEPNSDSDCEIVDVVPVQDKGKKKPEKANFNPKTVFLNKELSIKIAKKTTEKNIFSSSKKKIDIKGQNSVWLNESVMVKKVKSQSFLAQDSRNKKPPDFGITEEMVKLFFDNYYPMEASVLCAPYTSTEWLNFNRPADVICNYFILNKDQQSASNCTMDGPASNVENSDTDRAQEIREKLPIEAQDPTNMRHSSPKTLFSLCSQVMLKHLQGSSSQYVDTLSNLCVKKVCSNFYMTQPNVFVQNTNPDTDTEPLKCSQQSDTVFNVLPLKQLTCEKIIELCNIYKDSTTETGAELIVEPYHPNVELEESTPRNEYFNSIYMKTLSKLCVESVQREIFVKKSSKDINGVCVKDVWYSPDTLQKISLDFLKLLLYRETLFDSETYHDMNENIFYSYKNNVVKSLFKLSFQKIVNLFNINDKTNNQGNAALNEMTIGNINTIAEETFFNMEETSNDIYHETNFSEEDETYCDNDHTYDGEMHEDEIDEADHQVDQKGNWAAQVKLKELKGYVSNITNPLRNEDDHEQTNPIEALCAVRIKQEVVEEITDYGHLNIKKEPDFHPTEMVHIPNNVRTEIENIATKRELIDDIENARHCSPIQVERVGNYDFDSFETFVRSNKMMMNASDNEEDLIFSQSDHRVRRQHQPDSDNENDYDMGLLVPTVSEPLTISTVKGSLLQESSTDDDVTKDKADKKQDKRKKAKPKGKKQVPGKSIVEKDKPEKVQPIIQPQENKEKTKQTVNEPNMDDVAILTRRMREKIRNKEKKIESSDSETEDSMSLMDRKRKQSAKKTTDKQQVNKPSKGETTSINSTVDADEIQCNNVDSTEQIGENDDASKVNANEKEVDSFSGFTAADQNEITKYQKYLSDVYDKIMPGNEESSSSKLSQDDDTNFPRDESPDRSMSPFMNNDEPVELLECAPTLPIFEDNAKRKPKSKPKSKKVNEEKKTDPNETQTEVAEKIADSDAIPTEVNEKVAYTERNGWKCYPLNGTDAKLYQVPYVGLEKLPEEFVETYFRYQEISQISQEDAEIDRLSNLQNINRSSLNEGKKFGKGKNRDKGDGQKSGADDVTGAASPDISGGEFAPSDDEDVNVDDELPPPAPKQSTDNSLAKNLLMGDDNDSDPETADIKKEPNPNLLKAKKTKEKKVTVFKNPKDLVLTADKMMKKELEILHAPVLLDGEGPEVEPAEKKYSPPKESKHKEKHSTRPHTRRSKSDDSSSEEEKHWISTKEKLLKRMEKRTLDGPGPDDAKRAKLVTEYMRRVESVAPPSRKKGGRRARNNRKFLEKQKQMRVLNNELFGEPLTTGKRFHTSYAKGRRNIRKVIDKKSLQRSTVVANMEEFERKRRLHMKQNRLRELLGYEEGVNVLVINDEVCLEYDFEELQPVVTVHPFFTKVMKAHQYEGVKFMWDACFESLEVLEQGQGGGGCILAHCMGLGKTLQVLALLHTVLTHPRVGMSRVLVCCPLSTVLNWVDEIHKWLGPVTDQIKVFELSKLKKTYERAYQLEDWYTNGGIFIIGYELFRSLSTIDAQLDEVRPTIVNKIRTALLDPGPDIIVCDEGHLLKNDSSVLAIAMSRVATKRRIVLTGTPMQNNLREYYCMVNFVKPNLLGTYSEYSNRFENPIMNGQHRDSQEDDIKLMKARTHILHKVLEGCLQRQEASVLYPYLPKKHEYTVFITLTKCQSDMYKHYLAQCSENNKQSILRDYNVLQKVWSHPRVLHYFQMKKRDENILKMERLEDDLACEDLTATVDLKPGETDVWWLQHLDGGNMLDVLESSNKFVTVFSILEECVAVDDKLLIFSTSLFTMDALEYFLKTISKWSLGQEYYRLDGSVPPEVRQKWCREFNAEHNHKTKLFLISTRAGSLGLNMTAANRVIILDTSWNPAHDIQSIFRVYRFGQKKDCYIYRLVSLGTMEQKIYERAVTKQAVSCRVVDEQQIDRHYNMAELTELYSFDERGSGVASGVACGVRDVALLRVARGAHVHAVHEHDSLLRDTREQELTETERLAAWTQFQEEHTHKQMQNHLILPPSVLRKKLESSSDQYSTLAIHAQLAAPPPAAPAVKIETTAEQEKIPLIYGKVFAGPKSKNSKSATVTCDIPIYKPNMPPEPTPTSQPVTIVPDQNLMDPQANDMVNKIREALSKHTFNGAVNPTDLAKLVSNIISNVTISSPSTGNNENFTGEGQSAEPEPEQIIPDQNYELQPQQRALRSQPPAPEPAVVEAEGKAIVERKRGRPRKQQFPEPTEADKQTIVNVSTENTPEKDDPFNLLTERTVQKRGRPRKHVAAEIENVTTPIKIDNSQALQSRPENKPRPRGRPKKSLETDTTPRAEAPAVLEDSPDSSGKRRAAIAATRNLQCEETIIDLDDDDNDVRDYDDADYVPADDDDNSQDDYQPVNKEPAKTSKQPTVKTKTEPVTRPSGTNDSILLSDDEGDNSAIVVPLHPSLLSNKNFIKIVAHTYLKGNPRMDEDAATLAAEYSTSKALKEYNETKQKITGGPIYDIAVQVLGIDVLKKLQGAEAVNKPTYPKPKQDVKQEPVSKPGPKTFKEKAKQAANPPTISVKSEAALRQPVNVKREPAKALKRAAEYNVPQERGRKPDLHPYSEIERQQAADTFDVHSGAGVVPVGLINRSQNMAYEPLPSAPFPEQSGDECILPDDDDVRIISAPTAPPAPPAPSAPPRTIPAPTVYRTPGRPPTIVLNAPGAQEMPMTVTSEPSKKTPLVKNMGRKLTEMLINSQNRRNNEGENTSAFIPISLADVPKNARIVKVRKISRTSAGLSLQPPPLHLLSQAPPPQAPPPQAPPPQTPPPQTPPPQAPPQSSICLDSDDDDIEMSEAMPVHVAPAPQPVPVSLHRAGAPPPPPPPQIIVPNVVRQTRSIGKLAPPTPAPPPQNSTPAPAPQTINIQGIEAGVISLESMAHLQKYLSGINASNVMVVPASALQGTGIDLTGATFQISDSVIDNAQVVQPQYTAPTLQQTHTGTRIVMAPQTTPVIDLANTPTTYNVETAASQQVATTAADRPKPKVGDTVLLPGRPIGAKQTKTAAVLKKAEALAQKVQATANQPKAPLPAVTPLAAKPGPASKKPESTPAPRSRRVSLSSSSSSSRSPSPSPSPRAPHDPLSILKNVVHIQAPGDEISHTSTTKTITPTVDKKPASKPQAQGTKQKPLGQLRLLGSYDLTDTPASTSQKSVPTKLGNTTIKPSTGKPAPPKPAPASVVTKTAITPKHALKSLFSEKRPGDLLKKNTSDKKATNQPKTLTPPSTSRGDVGKTYSKKQELMNKLRAKVEVVPKPSSSVSGTSKNILIGGANKTLSKTSSTVEATSPSTSGRIVHITDVQTIPAKADAKRKAPPAATSDPKKKKPQPTRLEDFSLDDIEDIIELE